MFNWFKKKPTKDDELKAKLAESLKNYNPEDDTDSTWTDIEVEGRSVRVPKIKAQAIEELTLTEFEEDVTVRDLNRVDDPWTGVGKR